MMQSNNRVDFQGQAGDNANDVPIEGRTFKINKKDLVPLYSNKHECQFMEDGTENTEDWFSVKCVVEGCQRGRLIRKN